MSKKRIIKNILSIIVLFGAALLVRSVFAQDFGIEELDSGLGGALGTDDPRTIVGRIINIALGFLGVIALGLVIYAGFLWMTAGGEEEKIRKAKQILSSAVIGLAIILASWAIATFILRALNSANTGQGQYYCTEGDSRDCGCGGTMYCVNKSWTGCIGSDCGGGTAGPSTCSLEADTCVPHDDVCAEGKYCDSDCFCKSLGEAGDSCNTNTGGNICSPNDDLCGNYLSCDKDSCLCVGPPVITSISPAGGFCDDNKNQACNVDSDCSSGKCDLKTPNGNPGNFITIFGQNFGEYNPISSSVYFMGGSVLKGRNPAELNGACVNFWSDRQIIIAIPEGVSDGPIKVSRADGLEDLSNDDFGPKLPNFLANKIIRPGLCLLNPSSGQLNDEIAYQGVNLYSGKAYFGNNYNNVEALNAVFGESGYSGRAEVPNIKNGKTTSFVISNVVGNNQSSNFLEFVKELDPKAGPYINSFSPSQGGAGQYVTIFGNGFGNFKGNAQVYFGETEAAYDFPAVCANSVWTDNQIVVKVPENLTNNHYFIKIKLQNGEVIDTQFLNPNTFKADSSLDPKTSLCKIEPRQGTVTSLVKVYGEYFGNKGSHALLRFNKDKDVEVVIDKENKTDTASAQVPVGAITGPIKLIKSGEWGNELNFNIAFCQADVECGDQICCPANTYKQGRCVDTLMDCLIDIPNSVFEWRFNTDYGLGDDDPTDDPPPPDEDPCLEIDNFEDCSAKEGCCFDYGDSVCTSGEEISSGENIGYCAYYNCDEENIGYCIDKDDALLSGKFKSYALCNSLCKTESGTGKLCNYTGQGLTCNFDICNYPAMSCLTDKGQPATDIGDCGACCCNANEPESCSVISPNLYCKPDQGICSGSSRGLCCGCESDGDCGNEFSTGCGLDTCCHSRPDIIQSIPANGAQNVCRNAVIKLVFDQAISTNTWSDNILLLQEMPENSGVCPPGMFTYNFEDQDQIILASTNKRTVGDKIKNFFSEIVYSWFSKQDALAQSAHTLNSQAPGEGRLFCTVSINVSGEHMINENSSYSVLSVNPRTLLESNANYYLIVKGDENLNSQLGILSIQGIGMNGRGLEINGSYIEGENYVFNNRTYKNSHILNFRTLTDDDNNAGVCAVSYISVSPNSYLFKTNLNDLNENDIDANHVSFDTAYDRDKVISALAHSSDGQIIQPVTGYFWRWDFNLNNEQTLSLMSVNNLANNKAMVAVKDGITDGRSQIKAQINMDAFIGPNANNSPSCICTGDTCPENCRNAYSTGNNMQGFSDLYVFICNNPWPPQRADGTWYPWRDTCEGAIGENCGDYNYSFYYCRDAGQSGTYDDLPAISPIAVTRGQSNNLVCSSNGQSCSSMGTRCGLDRNQDGIPDGVCIWNILKESYFFRAQGSASAIINSLNDTAEGESINIEWQSPSQNISSFKIYYAEKGRSLNKSIDVQANSKSCALLQGNYYCQYKVVDLENNKTYDFQVSTLTTSKAESSLSNLMSVTVTDQRKPHAPIDLVYRTLDNGDIRFSWDASNEGTTNISQYYRLYRGVYPGVYGEYFEFDGKSTYIEIATNKLSQGLNYFSLSRVGFNNIESDKSAEVTINISE